MDFYVGSSNLTVRALVKSLITTEVNSNEHFDGPIFTTRVPIKKLVRTSWISIHRVTEVVKGVMVSNASFPVYE
jgi:hypothetical protein